VNANPVDVLVVGAGPTGLALTAQLIAHGVRPRLIDRATDRVHESRALAIQPRTLEVLALLGISDHLVDLGSQTVRMRIHAGDRDLSIPLFDLGLADTAYPFLMFLSQAETERILAEHLADHGIDIERCVELVRLDQDPDSARAVLRGPDGVEQTVVARYVVGCDGAHSAVRTAIGIDFVGGSYPQNFVLVDAEADGIDDGAAHVFLTERGMLFFFPLGKPASWRLLAMRPTGDAGDLAPIELSLDEVQVLVDRYTGGRVRLHDPVWMTNFRLHHRAARRYRSGRVFLAGDAAHIHSPAGAQGMNTGIQDAVNLAWKLAQSIHGMAHSTLLDTYEHERAPVGRNVLRFTDRAFTLATTDNAAVRFARRSVAPAAMRLFARSKTGRRYAFRTISQLAIRYRRSPLSVNGRGVPRRGPKAGDRLPDGPVQQNRRDSTLHRLTAAPGWHLLYRGATAPLGLDDWPDLTVHRFGTHDQHDSDATIPATTARRLGLTTNSSEFFVVRPDGHIGYRSSRDDATGLIRYLQTWLGDAGRSSQAATKGRRRG
jgi:2-polyprenyl-6-methoxyphenol hydroxylase-like FAD-dependent oxidoreductase